jgi:hypothetical protein
MRRAARRRVTTIAGAACLAVVVVAIVFRDELMVRHELHRIRGDEAYLARALERAEGTHALEAARRYLKSAEGLRALLGVFLDSDTSWLHEVGNRATIMVRWTSPDSYLLSWRTRTPTTRPWTPPSAAVLEAVREHLFRTDERSFTLPRHPGLVFRCVGVPRLRGTCVIERRHPPMAMRRPE